MAAFLIGTCLFAAVMVLRLPSIMGGRNLLIRDLWLVLNPGYLAIWALLGRPWEPPGPLYLMLICSCNGAAYAATWALIRLWRSGRRWAGMLAGSLVGPWIMVVGGSVAMRVMRGHRAQP